MRSPFRISAFYDELLLFEKKILLFQKSKLFLPLIL